MGQRRMGKREARTRLHTPHARTPCCCRYCCVSAVCSYSYARCMFVPGGDGIVRLQYISYCTSAVCFAPYVCSGFLLDVMYCRTARLQLLCVHVFVLLYVNGRTGRRACSYFDSAVYSCWRERVREDISGPLFFVLGHFFYAVREVHVYVRTARLRQYVRTVCFVLPLLSVYRYVLRMHVCWYCTYSVRCTSRRPLRVARCGLCDFPPFKPF